MDPIEKLTMLVATYGIYAILLIFIFVVLKRMTEPLMAKGTRADHLYFRRVHGATVAATFLLAAAASVVWWKVNVAAEPVVWGTATELLDQPVEPVRPGDQPYVEQEITSEESGGGALFLTSRHADPKLRKLQIEWLVRSGTRPRALRLHLVSRVAALDPWAAPADPSSPAGAHSPPGQGYVEVAFSVPVAAVGRSSANPIKLVYRPDRDSAYTRLGKLYLERDGAEPLQLRLDTVLSSPPARAVQAPGDAWMRWLVDVLYAQVPTDTVRFARDGSYDPREGDVLRQRLGSRDSRQQVAARDALVSQGGLAVRFITESADAGRSRIVEDGVLLLRNLADVLSRIEETDRTRHKDAWLALALGSYRLGDYRSAATAFQRAGASLAGQSRTTLYYRGFAYYQVGRFRDALNDFRAFARLASTNAERTAAHGMMGLQYARLGKGESAIAEYRRALTWDPNDDVTRNNLAYQLAEQNQRLNEALTLADRVVARNPNVGSYVDTKAWVLYKMRRLPEALALVDSAAALAPDNTTIRDHRSVIHAASNVPARR